MRICGGRRVRFPPATRQRPGKRGGVDRLRWGPGRRSRSVWPGEILVGRALLRRRKGLDGIEIGGPASSPEMSLAGVPCSGQVVPGVEAA